MANKICFRSRVSHYNGESNPRKLYDNVASIVLKSDTRGDEVAGDIVEYIYNLYNNNVPYSESVGVTLESAIEGATAAGYYIVLLAMVGDWNWVETVGLDQWDSPGVDGVAFVSEEGMKDAGFAGDGWREEAKKLVEAELSAFNHYLSGIVFRIDIEAAVVDTSNRDEVLFVLESFAARYPIYDGIENVLAQAKSMLHRYASDPSSVGQAKSVMVSRLNQLISKIENSSL